MLQPHAMFVLHENVETISMYLNLQSDCFLAKHERNLRKRQGDWLPPYALLLVIYNQLTTSLKLPRVEMKQYAVEIIMTGASNIDTEQAKTTTW